MAVHEQVQFVLDLIAKVEPPEFWQLTPDVARAQFEDSAPKLDLPPATMRSVEEVAIPVAGGEIACRLYTPYRGGTGRPIVVYYHGGGFVVGSPQSHDPTARAIADATGALVASVDYRLAPEHRFPTAPEDCWRALHWLADNAAGFGADGTRLAVAGDSAGGNLAAVTALRARDEGLELALQVLVYPVCATVPDSPSAHAFAEGYLLARKSMLWFIKHYIGDGDASDPRFSPGLAADLSGLAPALVQVAEFDPLRDEGIDYANAMMRAGNQVELTCHAGMVHGFVSLAGVVDEGRRAIERISDRLLEAFATG